MSENSCNAVPEEEGLNLSPMDWTLNSRTGILSIKERALNTLLRTEPIGQRYVLDSEPIARGQFAVVYHCVEKITGKEYAAKFSSRYRMGTDCTGDIVHEIAVNALLSKTPRSIHLVDIFTTEAQIILVMEYAPGGDIQTLLDEDMVPYEQDAVKFLRQLLEGLVYAHDRNIAHLDIKPQNLVLMGEFPNCAIKLCDFEISRMINEDKQVREILGTPDYVAPEILLYEPITTKTDMWSVGVLTYVLLTGFLPFGGDSDQETFMEVLKCELDFPSELFEDITPEAIDFIKKLLIKKPEHRMSAKESLNHVWMRDGVRRPTPPSTLNLVSSLNSHIPLKSPSSVDEAVTATTSTHLSVTRCPSEDSKLQTTPSKDIGRPPVHPFSSQRSLVGDTNSVTSTPAITPVASSTATPFVYRQESKLGSRHNLERLRSMSKSREVISERLQMSNMKKCLSKSRERLCDSRYGVSKSREQLMAIDSLSQSVEALSAFSNFNDQNVYQSCNNIFVPKIRLPQESCNNQERMYQSMAAIDQIDNIDYSKGIGFFESSMSLNNQLYNDMVTQHNTNINTMINDVHISKPMECKQSFGLRGNTCKGGRTGNSNTCENRCNRQKQQSEQANHNIKVPKTRQADKIKRDAQRKRKESREKEKQDKIKTEREKSQREKREKQKHLSQSDSSSRHKNEGCSSSTSGRRGSVCHVEQRLQERHERNLERMERQEKEEKKNKRRISVDNERNFHQHISKEKFRKNSNLIPPKERTRSLTPVRTNSPKQERSDVSQSSSLESVVSTSKSNRSPNDIKLAEMEELKIKSSQIDNKPAMTEIKFTDEDFDSDEAYASLEGPLKDYFISRSKSSESASSEESDIHIVNSKDHDAKKSSPFSSDEETNAEMLTVSEKIQSFENGQIFNRARNKGIMDRCQCESKELPAIAEESISPFRPSTPIRYRRSFSNTSDLSSLLSESSDGSSDKDSCLTASPTDRMSPEIQQRSRSFSTFSNPFPYSCNKSRSALFQADDTANNDAARPWGLVCSGAVARAIKMLDTPSLEIKTPSPLNSPSRYKLFTAQRAIIT